MAPSVDLPRRQVGTPTGGFDQHLARSEPVVGAIFTVIVPLLALTFLCVFFTKRFAVIRDWKRLPYLVWLLFAVYIDSYIFVFSSAVLQFGVGINKTSAVCDAAILVCLVFYLSSKLVYLLLVEKAHIIRGSAKRRMQSKLYLFNSIGMMGCYLVVAVLNFVYRINRIEDGSCVIGMEKLAILPLISFDALVNIYLTILFLIPLMSLYSFKNFARTPANVRLRSVAVRTFVGACCTLASSIVNLSVLMALNGEAGWVCLMCCNADIAFSAVVLYWVTYKDSAASSSDSRGKCSCRCVHSETCQAGTTSIAITTAITTDSFSKRTTERIPRFGDSDHVGVCFDYLNLPGTAEARGTCGGGIGGDHSAGCRCLPSITTLCWSDRTDDVSKVGGGRPEGGSRSDNLGHAPLAPVIPANVHRRDAGREGTKYEALPTASGAVTPPDDDEGDSHKGTRATMPGEEDSTTSNRALWEEQKAKNQ